MTGYNKEMLKGQIYGPYIGPITVNEVDGSNGWQSYKTEATPTTRTKKKKASRKSGIKELFHQQMSDLEGSEPKENAKLKRSHQKKEENYDEEYSEEEST